MGLKDFGNLKGRALSVSGWHPHLWDGRERVGDWFGGPFRWSPNFPFFNACLPSKHTFSGSLIPITEWILAGSTLLYQFARHFHLIRRSSCSSTSKWQSQEGWRKGFRECLQMPYRSRGGEGNRRGGCRQGAHFSEAVQSQPNLLRQSNSKELKRSLLQRGKLSFLACQSPGI